MSRVPRKDTKPEMIVRRYLHKMGLRYRTNDKRLPGSPDIVFLKYSVVIFVHGCFWHGHKNCKLAKIPSTNVNFWNDKITKNKDRDSVKKKQLEKIGWKVIIVWACALKQENYLEKVFQKIISRGKKHRAND